MTDRDQGPRPSTVETVSATQLSKRTPQKHANSPDYDSLKETVSEEID